MALETYRQEQQKLKKEEEIEKNDGQPVEEPKETMTLQDIMADKANNTLFGEMIQHSGNASDAELFARLGSGNLEKDDMDKLEKHRAAFEERMRVVEQINETLSPEELAEIGGLSKEFQKMLNTKNPENMSSFLKERMADIAMSDPRQFEKIKRDVENHNEFKKVGFKLTEGKFDEYVKKYKVTSDDILKGLAIEDPAKRDEALQNMIRNQWGNTHKAVDSVLSFFGGGSKNISRKIAAERGSVEATFKMLDIHKQSIGKTLAATISGNEQVRNALAKAIMGDPHAPERGPAMKEMKDSMPKQKDVDAKWQEFKNRGFAGRPWGVLSTTEKDAERSRFADDMKKEYRNKPGYKPGFWSSIFEAIFGSLALERARTLN